MFAILLTLLLLMPHWGDEKVNSIFFSEADMFFSKHIKDTSVDYKSIRKNPELLIQLVAAISAFDFKMQSKTGKWPSGLMLITF